MQKLFFILAILGVVCPIFADGVLSPELVKAMENQRGQLHVMVSLKQDVNASNLIANSFITAQGEEFKSQVFGMMQAECNANQHFLKTLVERLASTGNVSSTHFFWISNSVSMQADAQAIRELSSQPDIFSISLDEEQIMINPIQATEETRDGLWGLQAIRVPDAHSKGFKGQGVTVAVTDTGLNLSHPAFFAGQILTDKCKSMVAGEATVEDGHGHGTHCAGTVLSRQYGVAPEAKLISVKVLGAGGSGTWEQVQKGIEYASTVADVVSMSLGGTASASGNVVETAVKNGISAGVFFSIAAGNSGPSSKTIGTPGVVKEACTNGAIAEGGSIASFSSRGPTVYGDIKPDVVAPGVNVLSAWLNGGTNTISGTSMATPHVAGVAALLLSKNKSLKPADIKRILMSTASGTKSENVYGAGMVRCDQALNMVVAASEMNAFEGGRMTKEIKATTNAAGDVIKENDIEIPFDIVVTGVKSTMAFTHAHCEMNGSVLWDKAIPANSKNPLNITVKAGKAHASFKTTGGKPNTEVTLTIFFDFAE